MNKFFGYATSVALCLALAACGGGGGGTPTPSSLLTGRLVDSPVSGIHFTTATQSGNTNANGEFTYAAGENITFSVGSVQFPAVAANSTITPLDMGKTVDINHQVVSNILVLLQSLDEDGNSGNGISIPAAAAARAISAINFDVAPAVFASNPAVTGLVANSGSLTTTLLAEATAKQHFQSTLNGTGGTTKINVAPSANAGVSQNLLVGAVVTLDGSNSTDANNDALTYAWTLITKPVSSTAALSSTTSARPTFTADVAGIYVAKLLVSDGVLNSTATTVTVTATAANAAPVANAGVAQSVKTGSIVTMSGAASSDANSDPLTYMWTLASKPAGSATVLANATSINPTFVPDLAGNYVASLIVNDGKVSSAAAMVAVTAASANVAPVANAGVSQSVVAGTLVTLNALASSDANGDALTYAWALTSKPAGSTAALASATSAAPTFTADAAGTYVATLVVNDGRVSSSPATITVTAINPTIIGGIISTDTTLAVSQSPYLITNTIQIAYGATLTVEPGVSISSTNNAMVKVFGALKINGTSTAKVNLNALKIESNGTTPTQPNLIQIKYANMTGGSLMYANGNAGYFSISLVDSILDGVNTSYNNTYMYLWYPVADCFIERNIFKNSGGISVGVDTRNPPKKVFIKNNVFSGIVGPAVQNWASYGGESTVVSGNSFLDIDKVVLKLPGGGYTSAAMTATGNYWGTTNQAVIQSRIYDKTNDLSSAGYITFSPLLTQPDAATPAYP